MRVICDDGEGAKEMKDNTNLKARIIIQSLCEFEDEHDIESVYPIEVKVIGNDGGLLTIDG